jgi:pimeloyl-ACP methyl ester carboxylesterase
MTEGSADDRDEDDDRHRSSHPSSDDGGRSLSRAIPGPRGVLSGVLRRWREIGAAVVLVALLGVGGVTGYYSTPLPVDERAADEVRENPHVSVERAYGGYAIYPHDGDAVDGRVPPDEDGERTALVFYPGGRVAPESYLYTLASLVERANVTVFVPRVPLNLAILDEDAADEVVADHPEVDRWYVGGHSLGGAFACRHAAGNPDRFDGVVVFGSYCDRSLSGSGLSTLVVVGERDRVLNQDAFEENRENLPADARVVRLEGVNHSQFGAYSGQSGDVPGTVDRETARERLTTVVLEWHRNRSTGVRANESAGATLGSRVDARSAGNERRLESDRRGPVGVAFLEPTRDGTPT